MTMTLQANWAATADAAITQDVGTPDPYSADTAVASALALIAPISLQEVAGAALMDRQETKYLLPAAALPALLTSLAPDYRVLTMQGQTVLPYRSLYLDTPDFDLYHAHHNGRSRRYKVRFRSYMQTGTTFLEVKERQANGRTLKTRTGVAGPQLPPYPAGAALLEGVPTQNQALEPKLWVHYRRITLVGRGRPERVTIDLDLAFQRPGEVASWPAGEVVIIELKRASLRQASPLREYARAQGHREGGFSKYGVGCSLLHPVKHNAFKPQRLALQRLVGSA